MKTKFYFIILASFLMIFASCDDADNLLKDLAQGKMVVVINDGTPEMLDCSFINYGENLKGEVFIEGKSTGTNQNDLTLGYGNWSNQVAFIVKTYSTAIEADLMNVWGSYGNSDENNAVTIKIIEITDTMIKGEFDGKIATSTSSATIKGAFMATKGLMP